MLLIARWIFNSLLILVFIYIVHGSIPLYKFLKCNITHCKPISVLFDSHFINKSPDAGIPFVAVNYVNAFRKNNNVNLYVWHENYALFDQQPLLAIHKFIFKKLLPKKYRPDIQFVADGKLNTRYDIGNTKIMLIHDQYEEISLFSKDIPYDDRYSECNNASNNHYVFEHNWRNMRKTDIILTISQTTKDDFLKCYTDFPLDRIFVVYNAIPDTQSFNHSAFNSIIYKSKKLFSTNKTNTMLDYSVNEFFAKYAPQSNPNTKPKYFISRNVKNPQYAAEVVDKLIAKYNDKNIYMVIYGSKNIAPMPEKEIKSRVKHTDNIIFPGFVTNQTLNNLLHNTIGMLSMYNYEGFGLPTIEAMKEKAPILLSDTGANSEVLGDGGVLLQVDCIKKPLKTSKKCINCLNDGSNCTINKDFLFKQMEKLYLDSKYVEYLKSKSEARYQNMWSKYSYEKNVEEIINIYQRIKSL